MPWKDERTQGFRSTFSQCLTNLDDQSEIAIIVGPEDGFADHEVKFARRKALKL